MSTGAAAYTLAYQLSPIYLLDGIASSLPGKVLPLATITEGPNFTYSALLGKPAINVNDFFANWEPLPGTTLISNDVGQYPFANQAIAANAIITQPLVVSMKMTCPVNKGYLLRTATMTTLKLTIQKHINMGGLFAVATPSYFFLNCLLLNMRDISSGGSNQKHFAWQLDFQQPLVTENAAAQANADFINKIAVGQVP